MIYPIKPFLHPEVLDEWEKHGPPEVLPVSFPVTFDEWMTPDSEEGSLDAHLDPSFPAHVPTLTRAATASILGSIIGLSRQSPAHLARLREGFRGE